MWNLEKWDRWSYSQEIDADMENKYLDTKVESRLGERNWEIGMNTHTPLILGIK